MDNVFFNFGVVMALNLNEYFFIDFWPQAMFGSGDLGDDSGDMLGVVFFV